VAQTTRLLSRERLAQLSGFSDDEIQQIEDAGAISATDGGYRAVDLIKLELICQVAESSGGLEAVLRPYREGRLTLAHLDAFMPKFDFSDVPGRKVLKEAGIPAEELEQVMRAAGLPMPDLDQPLRSDDAEAFHHYARLRALPIPFESKLHAIRVMSESLHRAAEVPVKQFRDHIAMPILESYRGDVPQAQRLITDIAAAGQPAILGITHWLHMRFFEHEILKDVTVEMEAAARGGSPAVERHVDPAVVFVDLAGFTTFAAEQGDQQAAEAAAQFYDRTVDVARTHGGRVVKMLGDGAMLLFDDGGGAVRAGLQLLRELPQVGLPPARVGINRGAVVAQTGDIYGATVNTAARINEYARPNEVLVSASVLPDGAEGIALEEIGPVTLRGVPRPVRLFRARESAGF
jgi:class 3 adenylate cyclase